MCIGWRLYARILTNRKTFIVQRSYANAAALIVFPRRSGGMCINGFLANGIGEVVIDLVQLQPPLPALVGEGSNANRAIASYPAIYS
jgi:hypothetical protein